MPAGYSGTPLAAKLGIKDGARVGLIEAPRGFEDELQPIPPQVTFHLALRGTQPFDVIIAFLEDRKDLARRLPALREKVSDTTSLWLAWRKQSSGQATDLGEAEVRAAGLACGLVDVKVAAVTEVWSGLKFVIPVKDRAKPAAKPKPATKPRARSQRP